MSGPGGPGVELRERVGEGGMCEVYRAEHPGLGREVAVKLLRPELAADELERRRFLNEARMCARLSHPNVLAVFGSGELDGRPFIVMPFVRGGDTLRRRIDQGLSLAEGLRLLTQVAEALVAAHAVGILHRDLKPENVLVSPEGDALVADWGLARATEDRAHLTKTGVILGTPSYMAPEQISSGALSQATDMYALGVILYEVVAGQRPFALDPRLGLSGVFAAHLNQAPRPLAATAPGAPPALASLADGLLAKDPAARPAAAAVAADLRDLLDALDGTPAADRRPASRSELPRSFPSSAAPTQRAAVPARTGALPTVSTVARPAAPAGLRYLGAVVALAAGLTFAALAPRGTGPPAPSPAATVEARRDGGFKLHALSVVFPDELALAFDGAPRGTVRLAFTAEEGSPSLPQPVEADLAGASVQGGRGTLRLRLSCALRQPARVRVTQKDVPDAPARTFHAAVDPRPAVAAALQVVEDLRARPSVLDDLARTLRGVAGRWNPGAAAATRAAAEAGLRAALERHGLARSTVDDLRRTLDALVGPGLTADDELSQRLLPLRRLEAALAAAEGLSSPLGSWSRRLGAHVCEAGRQEPPPPGTFVVAERNLRTHTLPKSAGPVRVLPPDSYLLLTAKGLRDAHLRPEAVFSLQAGEEDYATIFERLRRSGSAGRSYVTTFHVEPSSRGTPTELRLDLHVWNFHRETALTVTLGGYPSFVVYNTSPLGPVIDARQPPRQFIVMLRLRVDRFRYGALPLAIEADDVPGESCPYPLGLASVSLLMRWPPAGPQVPR